MHSNEDTIISAGEARKGRMTATSDGVRRASDGQKSNSELNFGDRRRLENAIRRFEGSR